jgi:hypothetical protein
VTRVKFTGQLLQVGEIFDGTEGDTSGIELSIDGNGERVLIPADAETCKAFGESLYERVSITVEVLP